ncbi:MAG: hypothetical protein IGS48_08375 [Oscillatoriales cyanobacterium C42_A2020_001]|nr:hypothetical protein [Leptolyngbyaceae cyanobacterium C42_A2020_001]
MSKESKRKKTGWWLPALILLILAGAGIRYASSTEWWFSLFDRQRRTFQTVNTGASIQVSATNNGETTIIKASPNPGNTSDSEAGSNTSGQPRRMW